MCVFCDIAIDPSHFKLFENEHVYAIQDRYAVSFGHTLIISKRHEANFFNLNYEEQCAMLKAINWVKNKLEEDPQVKADGFNIGWNVNEAAGQTIMHVHAHVIPRKWGDIDDPTGGIRNVIPGRGNYRCEDFEPSV